MTSEFQARYSLFLKPDPTQMEAIDYLTGKVNQPPKSWQELGEVTDPSARLSLLTQAVITAYKDYSRVGRRRDAGLLEALGRLEKHYIKQYDDFMSPLCLNPVIPDISMFPEGSWALSFKFKLKKPYISKDDSDFYMIDNPIRKEWVFKLPYIAATQWKGGLRAALVKKLVDRADSESLFIWDEIPGNNSQRLIDFLKKYYGIDWVKNAKIEKIGDNKTIRIFDEKNCISLNLNDDNTKMTLKIDNFRICEFFVKKMKDKLNIYGMTDEEFADRRFDLTLLFGDEKGEEPGSDLAKYLDEKKSKEAAKLYRQRIRNFYRIEGNDPLPQHSGCLHFYPSYFTRIGLEVINPHDRNTGAGAQPIYFECVPSGAEGTFVLLYAPLCGKDTAEMKENGIGYLQQVAEGIEALMTQYGSGAKTSGGFGLAEENLDEGRLVLNSESIADKMHDSEPAIEIPGEFSKYLNGDGTIKDDFRGRGEEGLLSRKEFGEKKQTGGGNFSEFMRFKEWFRVHGKGLDKKNKLKCSDGLFELEFESFEDFRGKIECLANNQNGGSVQLV